MYFVLQEFSRGVPQNPPLTSTQQGLVLLRQCKPLNYCFNTKMLKYTLMHLYIMPYFAHTRPFMFCLSLFLGKNCAPNFRHQATPMYCHSRKSSFGNDSALLLLNDANTSKRTSSRFDLNMKVTDNTILKSVYDKLDGFRFPFVHFIWFICHDCKLPLDGTSVPCVGYSSRIRHISSNPLLRLN